MIPKGFVHLVEHLVLVMFGSLLFSGITQSQTKGYYPKGGPDNGVDDVSIIQLIANPQSYDGKRVRIIGFLHLEFEGNAIYLHREDFQEAIDKDALWIDVPKDMTRTQIQEVNDHYVICTGSFVSAKHGHMGMNSGTMGQITRLQVWTSPSR
jgi:hypothetical protein